MTALRVLYLGSIDPASTACHRAAALRRLGLAVTHIDPHESAGPSLRGLGGAFHHRSGYRFVSATVGKAVLQSAAAQTFDLCWVDSGELLSKATIEDLRQRTAHVVLFNHDDPTGPRDARRFYTLRRALPAYSLCIVVRPFNEGEFRAWGARDVLRVWMSHDEVAHAPLDRASTPPARFRSDIAFLGRNMSGEGRDELIALLIRSGFDVAVWGDNWQASAHWKLIEPHWRGGNLAGQDYVDAIRGAKLCLGMLSKGNRDEHTTRTMEIPFAGGLLCAQRTAEHRALYVEGEEAVFWADAAECLAQCRRLLGDDALRGRIRAAGLRRVCSNRVGNEDLCRAALGRLGLARAMQHAA